MSVAHCPVVLTEAKANKSAAKQTKLRWDKADLDVYCFETWRRLNAINVPIINSETTDQFCALIVDALLSAAESVVARTSRAFFKHWWEVYRDRNIMTAAYNHQIGLHIG